MPSEVDDAFKQGYDKEWPICFVIWRVDQLSKHARSLNDRMYQHFLARLKNRQLRDVVTVGARGQSLLLLLHLWRECGKNATTHLILEHQEHSYLNYKSAQSFRVQIRRMREYRAKVDPDVRDLLDMLAELKAKGLNDRDQIVRNLNATLYTDTLKQLDESGKTGAKAAELILQFEAKLKDNEAASQSSKALGAGASTGSTPTTGGQANNVSGKAGDICFFKLDGQQCKVRGCKRAHTDAAVRAAKADKAVMDRFKAWKERWKQGGTAVHAVAARGGLLRGDCRMGHGLPRRRT